MKKILIIDDDPNNRFLLRLVLEKHGFLVLEAETGIEGIDISFKEKPDLILLDVMMPDISGFEVLKKLPDIPTILLTALEEKEITLKVDYIQKPIDINLLIQKIQEKIR